MNEYTTAFLAAERMSGFEREAMQDRLAACARLAPRPPERYQSIAREPRIGLGRLIARLKLGPSHG